LFSFIKSCIPSNLAGELCWMAFYFDSIGEVEAIWLERDFEERELLEVVKAMNGDKALSPDGYSMAFF
jgi:hypothetical protein